MDDGRGKISYDYGYIFKKTDFTPGSYYVTVVMDDCSNCNVEIIVENLDTGKVNYFTPNMNRVNNKISVTSYNFNQTTRSGRGRIQLVL